MDEYGVNLQNPAAFGTLAGVCYEGKAACMWIVMLNGGLGNQMFQYIFALYLAQNGARVVIDDAAFFGADVVHGGFEVPLFFPQGVLPRLSEHFTPDVWAEMVARRECGMSIPEQLREGGLSLRCVQQEEAETFLFAGEIMSAACRDTERILGLPREQNIYFAGYWIDPIFYEGIQDLFLSIFSFPPFPRAAQARMAEEIHAAENATAIHVRRGDMAALGRSHPPEYFRKAIEDLTRLIHIQRFFLFSDDLAYCMEHAEELGLTGIHDRLTVVDGNRGREAYVDMQLMSLCRFRIADHSSFSQLAGTLCRVPGNLTTVWNPPFVTGYSIPV